MAQLMRHHRADLVTVLLHQIVVQRDAGGAEQAFDIGGDAIRLAAGINQIDIVGRHAIGTRQLEHLGLHRAIGQRCVVIEQRIKIDRRQRDRDHHHPDGQAGAAQPPIARETANGYVHAHPQDRRQQRIDRNEDQLLAAHSAKL